jgi:D-glycero-alpha-D-manno-heptose-7-phosphate kinase
MADKILKVRAKAPLRLGIAGGGTDVSPYSDMFGGCVLNATINLYAHTFIEENTFADEVKFSALDLDISDSISTKSDIGLSGKLMLHRAVYIRVMKDFNNSIFLPLSVKTFCDCPPGSGLGSSSAIVVSMLQAYIELLKIPLGEYDIAMLAYEIERIDCAMSGGKQDQYAATFGGFNFIEFNKNNQVIVNPLRIRNKIKHELEESLILFFMGASRDSAKIINDQIESIDNNKKSLIAMHKVKHNAFKIKEHLFKGDIEMISNIFLDSWKAKKETSDAISNPEIEKIEKTIMKAGARSMKVSGAGGGGFIMIFINPEDRVRMRLLLETFPGECQNFNFTNEGTISWTI